MAAPIIAIDGPAAAGKGTLARRLAAELGLPYLDTGLLYRAVGRRVLDAGAEPSDPDAATEAARALRPTDLERTDLRGPVADAAAAAVAAIPEVRAALLDFQRGFAAERGGVLDGRDIGTVIFPAAPAKLFVTASPEERARRRWLEMAGKGIAADIKNVLADIHARDAMDASRAAAPLRPADDAVVLDTTDKDPDTAFAEALRIVRARLAGATDSESGAAADLAWSKRIASLVIDALVCAKALTPEQYQSSVAIAAEEIYVRLVMQDRPST